MRVNKLHDRGNHLIVDGFSSGNLSDVDSIRDLIVGLKDEIGMTAISEPLVVYHEAEDSRESGVTGTIILAESNITIHTYPAKKWFALDVYSCNEFDVESALGFLRSKLEVGEHEVKILKRGFYDEKD
tara:strand:+ start:1884 stop:2267 length:384 start_codon:yes stop_codon:yes gene_type:complete